MTIQEQIKKINEARKDRSDQNLLAAHKAIREVWVAYHKKEAENKAQALQEAQKYAGSVVTQADDT